MSTHLQRRENMSKVQQNAKSATKSTKTKAATTELPITVEPYIGGGAATDTLLALNDDLEVLEMALRYKSSIDADDEQLEHIADSLAMASMRLADTIRKMKEVQS
jgi:hypothetical protein